MEEPTAPVDSPMASDSEDTSKGLEQVMNLAPTKQYPEGTSMRQQFNSMHDFATILVGPKEEKFLVHTKMLTAASPFFAAALSGRRWTEAGDQTVTLPEEKPEMFAWFMQWLFTGNLAVPVGCSDPSKRFKGTHSHVTRVYDPKSSSQKPITEAHNDGDLRNHQGSPKYFLLIELYGLSDRLLTTSFSNHIIDTFARLSETTNSVPTPSDTWLLYGDCCSFSGLHHCACKTPQTQSTMTTHSTRSSSPTPCPSTDSLKPHNEGIRPTAPLRDLVLDLFTYKKTDRLLSQHKDDWHPLFLRDLIVRTKRPGRDALSRHRFALFVPARWSDAKACEACRTVVGPTSVPSRLNPIDDDGEDDDGGGAAATGAARRTLNSRRARASALGGGLVRLSGVPPRYLGAPGAVQDAPLQCLVCSRVYCAGCVHAAYEGGALDSGDGKFSLVGGDVGPCKPWLSWEVVGHGRVEVALPAEAGKGDRGVKRYERGVCGRYHEHGWMVGPAPIEDGEMEVE